MIFSDTEIEEFQDLCELHLGFRLTKEEARLDAGKLVYLVSLIQPEQSSQSLKK